MKNLARPIIIGNWKMNLDYKSSLSLAKKISSGRAQKNIKNDVLLLPDFLPLAELSSKNKNKNIFYGAQDVSPFSFGPYTGEVSLENLEKLGCKYILVGHSERRQYLSEDKIISLKMENIIKNSKLVPILCVGENLSQRKSGQTVVVIKKQLQEAFSKIKGLSGQKIIIAYEPIWAIGTGKNISAEEAIIVHKKIKEIIMTMFKNNLPRELGVVYGGSVNLSNFQDFKKSEDISGLLIGGSSLKANDFLKIANNFFYV